MSSPNLHDDFHADVRKRTLEELRAQQRFAHIQRIADEAKARDSHLNQNTVMLLIFAVLAGALIVNFAFGGG